MRLLKSIYGGYQPNEWSHFFSELQINLDEPHGLARLFRDSSKPIKISAVVEFPREEREYIRDNAEELLEPWVWSLETGEDVAYGRFAHMAMAAQNEGRVREVREKAKELLPLVNEALSRVRSEIGITIAPGAHSIETIPNYAVSLAFSTYAPGNVGVIEYHSASRTYLRETLGGIDLNTRAFEDRRRQSSLYNWQNKYTNVKTELAATYLRGLVAQQVEGSEAVENVNDTIKELFSQFFPDKEYLGVVPEVGGGLSFPVSLKGGVVHDINELSSGEKEIVYGYLRLRNSAPRFSMILLDEPELHLNPALLRGLVRFYHQHLGRNQENQLWLVSHSDALLRQAVGGGEGFSVFHMTPAGDVEASGDNQAVPVVADDELQKATIAIVGDLASFKPTGRVVIVEGGGDSEFDASVLTRLAPKFSARVNIVSGGDKARVRALYETLDRCGDKFGAGQRFFAIVDRDFDMADKPISAKILSWSVYHIENFLIDEKYILNAVNLLLACDRFTGEDEVTAALRESANKVIDSVVYERVKSAVNSEIVSAINISGRPDSSNPAAALAPSIGSTFGRLEVVRERLLETEWVANTMEDQRRIFAEAVGDGTWRAKLPGRKVLKQFANDVLGGKSSYETLRNVIIHGMEKDQFCPEDMQLVIEKILNTPIEDS
ncbi:ATP-dependent nuclease [Nocardia testacea]|uniref:ATP-dependent nuclease n=1 Tax=Nocardia testacea TaxID=248551 RepID=UPI003C2B10AF